MWAWRSLYLVLVEEGCILPVQFYNRMIPQQVEILLYISLLPKPSLPLRILADLAMVKPAIATLIKTQSSDDPADVYKFFEAEIEG